MGIIEQGILGGFSNKTGTVVGARWRNLDVIRGRPRKSKKPATQAQIDQRIKFALVTGFLSSLSDLIDGRYQKGSGSASSMNEAVAYHLKNAITGLSPNFVLDYTKVRFSSGKIKLPSTYSVDVTAPGKVDFNWSLEPDDKNIDATDVINVMVYNPTKDQFVRLNAAAPRSAKKVVLQMPLDFVGDEVYCYFSFSSKKKRAMHSDSVYVLFIPIAGV